MTSTDVAGSSGASSALGRRLRVAHVGSYKPESANGVHQTLVGLVRGLPAEGIDCEVWHFTHRVATPRGRVVEGIEVFDLPLLAKRPFDALFVPPATRAWLRERSRRVDGLHLHSVFQGEHVVVRRLGLPYVLTPNGGYAEGVLQGRHRFLKKAWWLVWERSLLTHAAAMHLVSVHERGNIASHVPDARVKVIPNGVAVNVWLDEPAVYAPDGEWLCLCRLEVVKKGLDLLLDAYAQVTERCSDVPRLHIVGPDWRGGRAEVESMVARLDLTDRVRISDGVEGEVKRALFLGASLLLQPSRYEGLPLTILEAMALARPVLVTDGTNMADIVDEAGCGFTATTDVSSIAEAMARATATGASERREMGERGRQLVSDRYTWGAISPQMAGLYRQAFAPQHGSGGA